LSQEPRSKTPLPIAPAYADLRNVAHILAHSRAEKESRYLVAAAVNEHTRGRRVELTATWKTNDVVQESQRSRNGPVLIVDDAVQMTLIGMSNETAGSGKIAVPPGSQFQIIEAAAPGSFNQLRRT